jgi:hypothetical protein
VIPAVFDQMMSPREAGATDAQGMGVALGGRWLHAHGAKELAVNEQVTMWIPSEAPEVAHLDKGQFASHRDASS